LKLIQDGNKNEIARMQKKKKKKKIKKKKKKKKNKKNQLKHLKKIKELYTIKSSNNECSSINLFNFSSHLTIERTKSNFFKNTNPHDQSVHGRKL